MKKINSIIFDMDMTLIDSFDSFSIFLNSIGSKYYNKTFPKALFRQLWGEPHREFVTKIFDGVDNYENVKVHIENTLKNKPLIQSAIPNATKVIKELYGKYNIGILTSSPSIDAKERLKNAGFNIDHFEIIICSDNTKFKKPDPRVFDTLNSWLTTKNIVRDNVLYIGDAIVDFKAAQGAKICFIGVTTGFDTKRKFISEGLKSEYLVSSLSDVFTAISNLN